MEWLRRYPRLSSIYVRIDYHYHSWETPDIDHVNLFELVTRILYLHQRQDCMLQYRIRQGMSTSSGGGSYLTRMEAMEIPRFTSLDIMHNRV